MQILARYTDHGKFGYVRLRLSDGSVVQEHRWVMEQHLGRKLLSSEHVHHIDGNKHNNSLDNLEVLSASDHAVEHGSYRHVKASVVMVCPVCSKEFTRLQSLVRSRLKNGKTVKYCSNSCASRVNRNALKVDGSMIHGTATMYSHGKCRCLLCKQAKAAAHQKSKLKKQHL